jgi:hypothetical protein
VPASAQTVEVAPFAGYRFGGDLFELVTNAPVDLDGAPVVGGVVNIGMADGLSFEALFTRQQARVTVPAGAFAPPMHRLVFVDQWLAGGRQELGVGRVRPFLTGLVGLTRFGADGDNEVRFAAGMGGGVRLPVQRHFGVRFDGRVFTTFVDADAHARACVAGACLIGIHVNLAWQVEFTADLVVVF